MQAQHEHTQKGPYVCMYVFYTYIILQYSADFVQTKRLFLY